MGQPPRWSELNFFVASGIFAATITPTVVEARTARVTDSRRHRVAKEAQVPVSRHLALSWNNPVFGEGGEALNPIEVFSLEQFSLVSWTLYISPAEAASSWPADAKSAQLLQANFLTTVGRLWFLLRYSERRAFAMLVVLGCIGVFAEALGVASLFPFMKLAGQPDLIHTQPLMRGWYRELNFHSDKAFLVFIGVLVFVLLAAANAYSAFYLWLCQRYQARFQAQLSVRLLDVYLSRPYVIHLLHGGSEPGKKILAEAYMVSSGALLSLIRCMTRALLGIVIIAGLVYLDPLIAMLALLIFGGLYGVIYFGLRRKLGSIGLERNEAEKLRYKFVGEAMLSAREIKLLHCEKWATERVLTQSLRSAKATAYYLTASELPRYAIESAAFGGVITTILYLLGTGMDLTSMLPKLGVFTLAAYRLIAALQQGFSSLSLFIVSSPAVNGIFHDLATNGAPGEASAGQLRSTARLVPSRALLLEDVTYQYPDSEQPVLRDVSLEIKANTTVGFAGATGAGKSTIAALVLGLLEPTKGRLTVDNVALTGDRLYAWQNSIGYVPQDVVILDDTLSRNVAFGVPDAEIDHSAVRAACKIAKIDQFVEQQLPAGYETLLGERGMRLSGGQRQRVGIARALYNDPAVIIFDEATSALDGATEGAVMDAIRQLTHQRTIVLIAHRLTTLIDCDEIFLLKNGSITASGTYQQLMETPDFVSMARASSNGADPAVCEVSIEGEAEGPEGVKHFGRISESN